MKKNSAGGYSFKATNMTRVNRFLILGVEGNSYYSSQKELVAENCKALGSALDSNPMAVLDLISDIALHNRAHKRGPMLFALALAASHKVGLEAPKSGAVNYNKKRHAYDEAAKVRSAALDLLPTVARIPTDLYTFFNYVKEMRGMGQGLRKAFARWYEQSDLDRLAMHAVKYKARGGVSHRDLLRQGHPKTTDETRNTIFKYMTDPKGSGLTGGIESLNRFSEADTDVLSKIAAAEECLHLTRGEGTKAVSLIKKYRLTHEMVSNELKNDKKVWEALLMSMPVNAVVRNLGKMSSIGMFAEFSKNETKVVNLLRDQSAIAKSGIHPMAVYTAFRQYKEGKGAKGNLSWDVNSAICDALNDAFYLAMDNIEPTGKRILVGIDTSSSMTSTSRYGWFDARLTGYGELLAGEAAFVMASVLLHTEPNVRVMEFDTVAKPSALKKSMNLENIEQYARSKSGGGTDTSLPFRYAMDKNIRDIDCFVTFTDNETWSGRMAPLEAMKMYRNQYGHQNTRFINAAMIANDVSDVDPSDTNMMEVVGFDAGLPVLVSAFANGDF